LTIDYRPIPEALLQTLVCWFRRDLRVRDQTALYHAARDADRVIPLFIVDPSLMAAPHGGGPRVAFLLESLRALDQNLRRLGGYLLVRQGDPREALLGVLRESGAEGVYVNRDYISPGLARDLRVRAAVESEGYLYRDFKDIVVVEPGELLTGSGRPYSVYTPYWRAWAARAAPAVLPEPAKLLGTPPLDGIAIPTPSDVGWTVDIEVARGGEDEALRLLNRFTAGTAAPIGAYSTARNAPAEPGTSRLAPHIRFGTISPRTALAAARRATRPDGEAGAGGDLRRGEAEHKGPVTWAGELAWRDFYFTWMHDNPRVETHAHDPRYADLPFENDADLFAAWRAGQTGFPFIDAGMRQLAREGWMHNRLRMTTASFLCKDLLVDWRMGVDYFWQKLTCGDKPANVGGWQWSASVGTDAQPYFRVFNPVTQGERYDPTGAYVRRYVPELALVPDRYIHSPWTMPDAEATRIGFVLGKTYPAPVVDHAERRARAIAMFEKLRGTGR